MNRMKEIREAAGLSRYECAQHVGVARSYWGLLESGVRRPSKAVAKRIATFLETTLEELNFADATPVRRVKTTPISMSLQDDVLEVIDRVRGAALRLGLIPECQQEIKDERT